MIVTSFDVDSLFTNVPQSEISRTNKHTLSAKDSVLYFNGELYSQIAELQPENITGFTKWS